MTGKFYIETYGCQMNTAESGALRADLIRKGWEEAVDVSTADLVILNTCSVRKTAESRIWGRLGYFKKLKKSRDFKLIVVGCMAERLKEQIKTDYSEVDEVISNFRKDRIAAALISEGEDLSSISADSGKIDETYSFFENHGTTSSTHAMIPIMNGCDNFCSYCIVPYVRGREISRDFTGIIHEIKNLNSRNISEITLLGQNVNSYFYKNTNGQEVNFSKLLKMIIAETDTKWLRFTSSNPQDFSDELLDVIALEKRICGSIHLPAQHGSDHILERMNRKYRTADYIKLASELKAMEKGISLTTDLMVGFPGESEEDFNQLIDFMNHIRFEEAFTYYYNPREGTAAYNFDDDVPERVKLDRLSRIIELQRQITFEEKIKRVGTTVEAVIEGPSKKSENEILARTERNSMVVYPGTMKDNTYYVKIRLVDLKGNTFIGEM